MENLSLNAQDIGVAVVIVLSGLLALVRGFVKEMLTFAAWIGAAVATYYALQYVKPFARQLISVKIAADVTAGVVVFIVALIILTGITHWIASHVRQSHFSMLDRTLGFFFGLLRGAVVICLLWLLVDRVSVPSDQPPWITEARSLPLIKGGADMLAALVPEDVRSRVEARFKEAGATAREAIESEGARRLEESTDPPPTESTPGNELESEGREASDWQ